MELGLYSRCVPTESQLLSHIYARSGSIEPGAGFASVIGPGDDCALVRSPGGDGLLLTVDQLVEGRHFEPGTAIDLIARKVVARSVSDIAAMGGTPSFGLATGLLPDGYEHGSELFDAMARWAAHWRCPLVGGDIAFGPGPLSLTVMVGGLRSERVLTRSGARVGDWVYVSGSLGGSLASGRHLTFEPRVQLGRALTSMPDVHACLDLSDGLGRDAGRIAVASGVRIELAAASLPAHEGCGWRNAVGDGEDYELCFTSSDTELPPTVEGITITRVGRVIEGEVGCVVRTPDGDLLDAAELGWDHGSERPGGALT